MVDNKKKRHITNRIIETAEFGDAIAQYKLGLMYYVGEGVNKNFELATEWLIKSAEQNYADAQNTLGEWYSSDLKGNYNQLDEERAVYWFSKAAEQGHVEASDSLERLKKANFQNQEKQRKIDRLNEQATHRVQREKILDRPQVPIVSSILALVFWSAFFIATFQVTSAMKEEWNYLVNEGFSFFYMIPVFAVIVVVTMVPAIIFTIIAIKKIIYIKWFMKKYR